MEQKTQYLYVFDCKEGYCAQRFLARSDRGDVRCRYCGGYTEVVPGEKVKVI